MVILAIAAGGAIGAVLRYLAISACLRGLGAGFPFGTLLVNILGSFLMGVLAVLIFERLPTGSRLTAPFLMTGVLGGFTTFSAYSLDAIGLLERGRYLAGAGYMAGSVLFSILALVAGLAIAREVAA